MDFRSLPTTGTLSFGGHTFSLDQGGDSTLPAFAPLQLPQPLPLFPFPGQGPAGTPAQTTPPNPMSVFDTTPPTPSTSPRRPRILLRSTVEPQHPDTPMDAGTGPGRPASPTGTEASFGGGAPSAPRRGRRRRVRAMPEETPLPPSMVPTEQADNLQDERLVAEGKAEIQRRFQLDVDALTASSCALRRAMSELTKGIRRTEDRRDIAAGKEKRLVGHSSLLNEIALDSLSHTEVRDSLLDASASVIRAVSSLARNRADEDLSLREQWTALQLLHAAAGKLPASAPPMCGVCFDHPVRQAALPCGHVLCPGCMDRMTSGSGRSLGSCWVCRERVMDVCDVFFP